MGSGVEIALLCDVRISAAGTVFALPEVDLGMIPAAGGTQTLPRNIGTSIALDLLLTGRRWDAEEALRMGLVTRVVSDDNLMSEAWRIARQLAAMKASLAAAFKECLLRGADVPLSQALPMEAAIAARALG